MPAPKQTARNNQTALEQKPWLKDGSWALLLLVAVVLIYWPALSGGFVWDDDAHITKPELRSLSGLGRIWTVPGATQQYYPLVHSAFWVEHRLWGDAPSGYHLVNLLLHAGCALLLLKILRRLEVPGAGLAAAIFALHPIQVESVAWISELKNTLSGICCLGAALVYLGFDHNRKRTWHAAALGLFVLGLLAKTVIATLPAALLVVFWWKRGRLSWKKDVPPLLPFFAVGIVAGLFTAWMERKFIGAEGSDFNFSIIERGLIAGRAFWFYLGKLFWPADLMFIYPRWNISQDAGWQYLFPAAALLLLAGLWWLRGRSRGPLAALLFFAGTLFPALGFFNVYPFRYSFVADHFQYLAGIGPVALAASGMVGAAKAIRRQGGNLPGLILAGGLLLALGTLSWRQCATYADVETLWQTTIQRNPGCWMAYDNLGRLFLQQRRLDETISEYQRVLQIKPDFAEARNNLGLAYFEQDRLEEAIAQYQLALAVKPGDAEVHYNFGNALFLQERLDEAIAEYQKALTIRPDYGEARNNLGNALLKQGRLDEAIAQYQKALGIQPDDAVAFNNLGSAWFQQGRLEEAIIQFQKALAIRPDYAKALYNLGNARCQQGRLAEGIAQYQKALISQPDNMDVQNRLAWVLATCPQAALRNGPQAVRLAERANQLTRGENPAILCTLAAACAEAGRFTEAVATAQHALQLARAQPNPALAGELGLQLKLYQAGLPFHNPEQPHPTNAAP